MSQATSALTLERFVQGYRYAEYVASIQSNRAQFEASYQAFILQSEDARFCQELQEKRGPIRVLALAEDWCPDVIRGLPVMAHIAEAANLELRIFPRDKNLDVMNLYLNQGKFMSIPVFAFFDGGFAPLGHWTERPAVANQAITRVRVEMGARSSDKEVRVAARERLSLADWQQAIVQEFRNMLAPALATAAGRA